MPEKQNNNKIMAMLERRGIIRKADTDDEIHERPSDSNLPRSEVDIKALFDSPDDNAQRVTPASRQPVPGMPSPVFPSEKPASAGIEQTRIDDNVESKQTLPAEPEPRRIVEPLPSEPPRAVDPFLSEPQRATEQPRTVEPQRSVEPTRPAPVLGSLNPFKNGIDFEEKPAEEPVEPTVVERAPQPENYTDRYLNTEELYDALALRSKKTDSIYLIEDYLQTLPDSLPEASRREIVSKLIAASGFDYDLLMGDGVLRVKMLREYAERFARHTDDYIAARQAELDEMDQQILRTRRLIENRKELHKKQFFSIEAEAQRLKEILTFISG